MLLKLLLMVFIVIIDLTDLCRSADSKTKNEDSATSSSTVSQEQTSMPLFMKGHHYVIQGNEQMRAGDPKNALRSYNKAIEKNSKRWSYFGLRGLCLLKLNKVGSALENFETAVQMAKDPQNNDTKPSLMNDVELIKMGEILCESKSRYELAIWCFNEAAKIEPINAHRALGQCYMRMGEWKLAVENFASVVENNPRNKDDRKLLSQALLENGDFNGALKEITEVDDTGAEFVRIGDDLKYMKRNSEEALKFYDKAIEKSPKNALYYQKRGKCFLDVKGYNTAVSDFREALNLDPKIENGHDCLTEALFYSGQRNEAMKESAKLSSLTLQILGRKFLRNEKFDEALDCYNEALEKDSKSAFGYEERAICHRKLGNLDNAISDIRKSLSIQDDNWSLRLDFCELLLKTNSNFEAEKVLTDIERHYSEHPYYWPPSYVKRIELARLTLQNRQLEGELKETDENRKPEPITTPPNSSSNEKNSDDNPSSEYSFPNL